MIRKHYLKLDIYKSARNISFGTAQKKCFSGTKIFMKQNTVGPGPYLTTPQIATAIVKTTDLKILVFFSPLFKSFNLFLQ